MLCAQLFELHICLAHAAHGRLVNIVGVDFLWADDYRGVQAILCNPFKSF